MNKQEIIEKLEREKANLVNNGGFFFDSSIIVTINAAIQSLTTEPQVDKVTAELESKHTPEPWKVIHDLVITMQDESEDVAQCLIHSDAQRIVDCVNAMKGVNNPMGYMQTYATQSNAEAKKKTAETENTHQLLMDLFKFCPYAEKDAFKKRIDSLLNTNAEAMRKHAIGFYKFIKDNHFLVSAQYNMVNMPILYTTQLSGKYKGQCFTIEDLYNEYIKPQ